MFSKTNIVWTLVEEDEPTYHYPPTSKVTLLCFKVGRTAPAFRWDPNTRPRYWSHSKLHGLLLCIHVKHDIALDDGNFAFNSFSLNINPKFCNLFQNLF